MPWAAADPVPTAVAAQPQAAPKPANEASQTSPSIETAALPANDAPTPSALAAPADDTVEEPIATVAPVERVQIATVEAEPAPPEKALPWQSAANHPPVAVSSPTAETTALPWVPAAAPPAPAVSTLAQADPPATPAAPTAVGFASDPPSAPAAMPSVVTEAPAALADAGKAAGAFVSSLFGGGTVAPKAEEAAPASAIANNAAPIETAALPERPKPADPAPAGWTAETAAAPVAVADPQPATTPAEVKVAAAEMDPPVKAQPAIASLPGPYRLQIAAENSRADAEQTLSRLVSGHRTSLRGLEPVIEEPATGGVLFGSMGAAYRVSVGPYASSMEPGRLCNILKPHGFDCRVVAVTP